MSDSITIARPYAKAVFEHALSSKHMELWSANLQALSALVQDAQVSAFIHNPATNDHQHSDLILALLDGKKNADAAHLNTFVQTLAQNKRLMVLPQIQALFEVLRSEQEKTLAVDVISYSALSDSQEKHLITSLSKRLQRQVTLNVRIDSALLGGAVIHAGDLVIDGSVRGKLNKLATGLAA